MTAQFLKQPDPRKQSPSCHIVKIKPWPVAQIHDFSGGGGLVCFTFPESYSSYIQQDRQSGAGARRRAHKFLHSFLFPFVGHSLDSSGFPPDEPLVEFNIKKKKKGEKKAPQSRQQSRRETGAGWCELGFFFNRCSETLTREQRKIGQGEDSDKTLMVVYPGQKRFSWWDKAPFHLVKVCN